MRIALLAGKSGATLAARFRRLGHPVELYVGDERHRSPEALRTVVIDLRDVDRVAAAILASGVDGLAFGTGYKTVFAIAEQVAAAGLPISHAIGPSLLFKHKGRTKELFRALAVPTPASWLVDDPAGPLPADARFPLVVKSLMDEFPVFLAHGPSDLAANLPADAGQLPIMLETYLPGNDATILVAARRGRAPRALGLIYWSKQLTYRLKGFEDLDLRQRLDDRAAKRAMKDAEGILGAAGYHGVARCDLRIDASGYRFLEVNSAVSCRTEGTSYQAFEQAGIRLDEVICETCLFNLGIETA